MKRYDGYLFDTLQECCEAYFVWNVEGCMNPELAGDPCSSENVFSTDGGYNTNYLTESEVGYWPNCKYPLMTLQVVHALNVNIYSSLLLLS